MTNDELNKYFFDYLEHDKTHSAIMLTAPWGTGKSYYIQNELKPFLEKEENGKHQCIVVSLYGLKDLFEVSKALYLESRMKFLNGNSEKAVTGKFAAKTVLKGITSFFGIDLSKSEDEMRTLYDSVDLSGKLIILEDLERSGINIIEILGYVSNLVEQDGVKVLLVANEKEILKYTDSEPDKDGRIHPVPDEYTENYLKTKEKTISDTILFPPYCESAIEGILHSFHCDTFEKMLKRNCPEKERLVSNIIDIMIMLDKYNLRSFIYGCQKTYDLYQRCDDTFDIDFLEYLFYGNVAFALRLKENDNLKWENEESAKKLGTDVSPLLKVAYDYIKYQHCDTNELKKANDTYCRQKEFQISEKAIKIHLDVIYLFYESLESEVSNALAQVTNNLETSEDIPFGEFGKLSNYLVAIHKAIGHDDEIRRCRAAMVNRIENSESASLEDDLRFHSGLQLNSIEENAELSEWSKEMLNACKIRQQAKFDFDYQPENAEKFENYILMERDKYVNNHVFAKRLDIERLMKMIANSSARQIASIRSAFLGVYSFSNLNDFFEGDKETLEKLKDEIDKLIEAKKNGDKIVLLQLRYFSGNLKSIIERL